MGPEPRYRRAIRNKYNGIDCIWEESDQWHARVHKEIAAAITRLTAKRSMPEAFVVDVGSGGYPHVVPHRAYLQVDIAEERLHGMSMAVCADAHALPLVDGVADCVLCVGPVANYCSLIDLIAEVSRITKAGGLMAMHVELSNSLEYFLTPHFRQDVALVTTFYKGEEQLWAYSDRNVREVLARAQFRILHTRYFHIASALVYRIAHRPNAAAAWAALDNILGRVPGIGSIADSVIFICEKAAY